MSATMGLSNLAFLSRAVAVPGFSPSDIANLEAWHDAEFNVPNGDDASELTDQSGNGNHLAQTIASKQPFRIASDAGFNNKPVVEFDGVTERMLTAAFAGGALSQPNTIIFVAQIVTLSGARTFYDGINGSNRHSFFTVGGEDLGFFAGTVVTGIAHDLNPHIYVARFDGVSSELYLDGGTPDIAGNAGGQTLSGFSVGSRQDDAAHANIRLAEDAIYDRSLTDTELNDLGNHYATKFGITWTDI